MISATENAAVKLYYNGAQKLATTAAGADVTGTVTADGLTVDGRVVVYDTTQTMNGGISTEANAAIINFGLNEGSANRFGGSYTQANQGGMLNFDTRAGQPLFQIYTRAAGTAAATGTASFNIDSAGNVGIGTSSPSASLHLKSTTSGKPELRLEGAGAENGIITFLGSGHANPAVGLRYISSGDSIGHLAFYANSSSSSTLSERMRIDSSGFIGIGETSPVDKLHIKQNGDIGACLRIDNSNTSSAGSGSVVFERNGTVVGTIQLTGSATIYGTSSDYRLKENVVPMSGATAKTKLLKPCNFDWINFNENTDGFLAHELAEVVPDAVYGTKDAMRDEEYEVSPATGEVFTAGSEAGFTEVSTAIAASPVYYDVDGNVIKAEVIAQAAVHEAYEAVAEVIHSADVEQPETLEEGQQWRETTAAVMGTRSVPDMQGIDQAKLVPLLTATIQELIARIEALEA
jgi:hypothetical protein